MTESGVVPQEAKLPNFSTAKGSNGEAQFIIDADKWWNDYTGAPSFCEEKSVRRRFAHRIATDGYSASIATTKDAPTPAPAAAVPTARASKRKRGAQSATPDEAEQVWLRGITADSLSQARQRGDHMVGLDPGRRDIFTAVYHHEGAEQHLQEAHPADHNKYRSISWSKQRWYEVSGINEHIAKSNYWLKETDESRRLHQALLQTPTAKVANEQAFCEHITHRMQHAASATRYFRQPCHRKLRRKRKIRRQAALQQACNTISCYRHSTIVAYGDAKFASSSKGLAPTPTSSLRRQLANTCRVCDVDEFRTSKLCSACHRAMLGMRIPGELPPLHKLQCTALACTQLHQ